jgi:OOP family OmpA-OmpF porin
LVVSDGQNISRDPIAPVFALKELYGERLCIHTVHVGDCSKGRMLLQEVAQQSECGIAKAAGELQSAAAMKKFIADVFYSHEFVDSDGDGVADSLDRCPNTPKGVKVAANGCPLDSDRDGVPDYLDKCPNTPREVRVDKNGCPLDSDGDGVLDSKDKCPGTPKGVKVDPRGCPLDTDGDGVADYLDKCPGTPKGVTVNRVGCWVIRDLKFDYNKWDIKSEYYSALDRGVEVVKMNPTLKIEVQGHTDSVGSEAFNLELSQKRANAVRDYLIKKGVSADRLTAKGMGEADPIASNDTPAGRAENRRVEFDVISY